MKGLQTFRSALIGGASVAVLIHSANAKIFDIPRGDLEVALNAYTTQAGVQLIFSDSDVRGHRSSGAKGQYSEMAALTQLLKGSGFNAQMMPAKMIGIVPDEKVARESIAAKPLRVAAAAASTPSGVPSIETVVVTAQKKTEDIQQVPIAVTALSQQQLTERQIAGGPDLVKEVPNLTFSKTNFSGYNLEIRGIGTQAISATTDPAVAVALNNTPFIRNHFFEQEFFDLSDVEVLRGPQGTLYGRNATAGVVNIEPAKPSGTYEAMLSTDFGNYSNRRFEGMLNIPIVGDQLDLRIAGEWTKRDGYSTDTTTNTPIDGRDLWSGRMTLGWKPASNFQAYLVWEHFQEDDDRLRSGKQLCETDPGPTSINGVPIPAPNVFGSNVFGLTSASFSQGCLPASLYSKRSFEVPNGYALPFVSGGEYEGFLNNTVDPYASTTQSTNLRDIQSAITPTYRAKNDTVELNADWNITPTLTLSSQTGYNHDFLFSSEDYNRFDTSPGVFVYNATNNRVNGGAISPTGVFCDPQLGCSDRLVVQDLSTERAWQASQEFRLASDFKGPLNFSFGANYLHYETVEDYYVFANSFTMISLNNVGYGFNRQTNTGQNSNPPYIPGVTTDAGCLPNGFAYSNPKRGGGVPTEGCQYIDPNPITSLNNEGHNYFLSQNPYVLNSYATFGEVYYNVLSDLKITAGARWTDDQKHFLEIPSWLVSDGYGYPVTGVENQKWDRWTGRFVADWSPKVDFTDQTLIYASVSHGYKAGGANPPGPVFAVYTYGDQAVVDPTHPLTFKPEYIEAFELGTKNSLLDGALVLNGDVFYYNYTGYQISQIVDRSALNLNFNAHVEGAELESTFEPIPGLKFSLAQGFENTALAGGSQTIDLMNRTNSNPNWVLMRPFVTNSSNCIFPSYVAAALLTFNNGGGEGNPVTASCAAAYEEHLDPVTLLPYVPNPTISNGGALPVGYPGFDPSTAPNSGKGFYKNISGNKLPGSPRFTTSISAEYSTPISPDWAATLHTDFYWQSQSWARVENDNPYDKIHGYSNVNLSLILTNDTGWQAMAYVKNVFNTTAITGDFLNSDDSGLTTNVFLTDPRLYGIRITKHFDEGDESSYGVSWLQDLFADKDRGPPPLWLEVGGQFDFLNDSQQAFAPPFVSNIPTLLGSPVRVQDPPSYGLDWNTKLSYQPDGSDWVFAADIRYGRSSSKRHDHHQSAEAKIPNSKYPGQYITTTRDRFADTLSNQSVSHMIIDFMAGKDVGLGIPEVKSVLSGGVRIAQFRSSSSVQITTDPDYTFKQFGPKYWHNFSGSENAKRSFVGIGPAVSWDASMPFAGDDQNGKLTFDWGANAGVLFGRQKARGQHQTQGRFMCYGLIHQHGPCPGNALPTPSGYDQFSHYTKAAKQFNRSRFAAVPNLGGFAGVSMRYQNAKVSFGYRIDTFFGAMDGGLDERRSFDVGFHGPFASITVGLGG